MHRVLALSLVLSYPAWAFTSSARLLTADGALDEAAGSATAEPPVLTPSLESSSQSRAAPLSWRWQLAVGSGAALISVPASLYLGQWVGSLSNSILGAALPTLLVIGLLPPAVVTFAVWLAGNWNQPGTYRWWPALVASTVVNAGALVVGGFLGLSVGVAARVIVFTLVQALMLPTTATLVMRGWPLKEPNVLTTNDPAAPVTYFAPAATLRF